MAKTLDTHAPSSPPLSAPWRGAAWLLVSVACFSGINGIVRHWSGGVDSTVEALPVNVMMFFQNIFGTVFLLPWILKAGIESLSTRYAGLHLTRVIAAVAGVYFWYLTLKAMPIAEGVALSFTGPVLTVIAAAFWLREKISFSRMLALLCSFTGAFIISRPDIALSGEKHAIGWAVFLPLSSALAIAISKLLTRKLATLKETPTTLATYLLLLMTPVSLLPALYEWTTPSSNHWPWLISLGALAAAAHLSFAKAYQLAEVSFLTPFGFSKFFINVLLGFLAFSELPNSLALWIGTATIFSSIALLGFSGFKNPGSYKMALYSWANRFRSN